MEDQEQLKGYAERMMEKFVRLAEKMAKDQGLRHAEFAQMVWPESSPRVAAYRWQSMRTKVRNTGKPQGVLISDAYRMSLALNQDLAYMFLLSRGEDDRKEAAPKAEKRAAQPDREEKGRKPTAAAKKATPARKCLIH